MAVVTQFMLSVLGQDIFYDGFGGITTDPYNAIKYPTFADAEMDLPQAVNSSRDYGIGWEIRTILVGQSG